MKRFLSIVLSFACIVTLLTGCNSTQQNNNDNNSGVGSEMDGKINVLNVLEDISNVKTLGRTYYDSSKLWLAFSGAGAAFEFTGTKCTVVIEGDSAANTISEDNYARIAIEVNGERVIDDMIDESLKTYTVFESDKEETVQVSIIKLSESAMSLFGISSINIEGSSVKPMETSERKIEFIGDSITCGYGVDDPVAQNHFSTKTEDVTKAYAYMTAKALGADYSMVSFSGYGVISGFSNDGNKTDQIVSNYYDSLGFSYTTFAGGQKAEAVAWDHESFQPDIVVINLGTNDDSYCQNDKGRQLDYQTQYTELIKKVRAANPDAHILCTLGIMGDRLFDSIEAAVEEYKAQTGDTRVSTMKFDVQNPADGYSADWHPSVATHQKAAQKLTDEIRNIMGW